MCAAPTTYGDVDGLITLLQIACEDPEINATLQKLLVQPDAARRAFLEALLPKLRAQAVPASLVEAMACLMDDAVAEAAFHEIYQCNRPAA